MQYAAGESSPEASKLLAAIGHYWPRFSRHGAGSLPRAARAAKGFQRMAPSRSRPPLPWLALMCMMGSAMHAGQFPFALFLLMNFVMYPRPGELLSLRPEQIVAPTSEAGSYARHWSILLAPSEWEIPGKTGEYDETLRFDWDELAWTGPLWHLLAARRKGLPVWPFDAVAMRRLFDQMGRVGEHAIPPPPTRR